MQDAKAPDVSYVTEPQRRWIERTYAEGWDKLQVRVIDQVQWISLSLDEPIAASELIGKIGALIDGTPDKHRHSAAFRVKCDGYSDCYLNFTYTRLETEREFNQRIASYLHRWEKIRDENLKEKELFGLG